MVLAEDVREWVCSQWDPVIMVQASPEVDAMCMESNGMSFVELLRPFGTIRELNGAAGGASCGLRQRRGQLRLPLAICCLFVLSMRRMRRYLWRR